MHICLIPAPIEVLYQIFCKLTRGALVCSDRLGIRHKQKEDRTTARKRICDGGLGLLDDAEVMPQMIEIMVRQVVAVELENYLGALSAGTI
ncbi:MAG: hypothetical protein N2246_05315 [Candidatus Sumerlaeia bacterium]|nr:hypothetical protein [Candidatus Sumerlaeia bacterium]